MTDAGALEVLTLGLFLVCGLGAGLAATRVGLPRVAAYVLAGMVFSPSLLGDALGIDMGEWTEALTTVALGIIAYVIGGSITAQQLRRTGPTILAATTGESLGAAVLVATAVLALAPQVAGASTLELALLLGALATTTAPAATVAVLHQYRARGPVTNTLLGVVALDDAVGIMLFAVVLVVAVDQPLVSTVGIAVFQIGGAVLLGGTLAGFLAVTERQLAPETGRLPLIAGCIMLGVGVAELLGLATLLAAMSLGFFSRRFSKGAGSSLLAPVEPLEETVFVIFFTLAGAHFQPDVFRGHTDLIVAYLVARTAGKMIGARIGTSLVRAPTVVVRWLGLGLVPQAGVAVGLALTLVHHPEYAEASSTIVNVILATTVVYELVGPVLARFGLQRAGELGVPRGEHS